MLIQANALQIPLADESVDCVVTSPPYWGLRCYGVGGQLGLEKTPDAYVERMVEVFREVRRVLKPAGTVWLNLGDSFQNAKGQAGGIDPKQPARRHGLRPNDVTIPGLKRKDLVGIPWRVAFALQADGWWLRSDIIWAKPDPMPESVTDRPTKAHEYVFLLTKNSRYWFDAEAVREKDSGQHHHRNIRTVWNIATQPYKGSHFATFPEAIPKRCILAGCPPDGLVLDPFVGSGTTVRVARSLGRRGVGLDLNGEYLASLASDRVKVTQGFNFCS